MLEGALCTANESPAAESNEYEISESAAPPPTTSQPHESIEQWYLEGRFSDSQTLRIRGSARWSTHSRLL